MRCEQVMSLQNWMNPMIVKNINTHTHTLDESNDSQNCKHTHTRYTVYQSRPQAWGDTEKNCMLRRESM